MNKGEFSMDTQGAVISSKKSKNDGGWSLFAKSGDPRLYLKYKKTNENI